MDFNSFFLVRVIKCDYLQNIRVIFGVFLSIFYTKLHKYLIMNH